MNPLARLLAQRSRSLLAVSAEKSPRRSREFPIRLQLEPLEIRQTLTGNLTITGLSVVNANDQPLSNISAGQWVSIEADFTTQNLPANASYLAAFTVNGLTLDSAPLTLGAGGSGTQSWKTYLGAFQASPGINQVMVVLNPNHTLPETTYSDNAMSITFQAGPAAAGTMLSYTAAQIRQAYGFNSIPSFGAVPSDGSGQTIALVEAGNDPTILSDLDAFDQAMSLTLGATQSLYQQYGAAASFVNVYNQDGVNITANLADSGSNGVPAQDPSGKWEGEETMDVEWAHAMAPGARIDVVEVNDDSNWANNLLTGVKIAAGLPGVTVVSNSWGLTEWSGETAYDSSTFVTPGGHPGVTFLASSGDNGANAYWPSPSGSPATAGVDAYYPSSSLNVIAVGGTQLSLSNNSYAGEAAWSYPAPTSTITNGSSAYAQTGAWTSQSGGYSGTYSTAAGGSSSSATWTITVNPANTGQGTELSATWIANSTNATNATYTVYDGTSSAGTILGTVTINQSLPPTGTAQGDFQFQELGVFFPTLDSNGDGALTVVLSASSANGTVVADALASAPAWATSGGPSQFEPEPSYQLDFQGSRHRTTPDVAFDASFNSGVTCFQNGKIGYSYFGTSLGSPCWAGLIAIANQGRTATLGASFNSPTDPTQILQALYSAPPADFHPISSGYNGFSASSGYNPLTGLGTPIANLLIPYLASYGSVATNQPTQLAITTQPPTNVAPGQSFSITVAVENPYHEVVETAQGSVTLTLANDSTGATLTGDTIATITNGIATFSDLVINTPGIGYRLTAISAGLSPAITISFNVTAPATPPPPSAPPPGSTPPTPPPAPPPVAAGQGPPSTITIVQAQPRFARAGKTVTLTATVKIHGRPHLVPSGDVSFWDRSTFLGVLPLKHGKATLRTTHLPIGPNLIHVDYTAAAGLSGSSSAPLIVTIRQNQPRPNPPHQRLARSRKLYLQPHDPLAHPLDRAAWGILTQGDCTLNHSRTRIFSR